MSKYFNLVSLYKNSKSRKEAGSAHCKSSRNITRGVFLFEKTFKKFSKTIIIRFMASFD